MTSTHQTATGTGGRHRWAVPPPEWVPPDGPSPPDPARPAAQLPPVPEIALHAGGALGASGSVGHASFSAFYRDCWPKVARGLAVTLGDRDLAAEATDEAMARAYQRWSTIQHYEQPAGWVYRVGLNWARSYHRRAIRRLPFVRADHVEAPTVEDPSIEAALAALDIKHRSVVVCRLLLDWSVDETADALGIRPGTVKSRLHRALTQLQTSLAHLR